MKELAIMQESGCYDLELRLVGKRVIGHMGWVLRRLVGHHVSVTCCRTAVFGMKGKGKASV